MTSKEYPESLRQLSCAGVSAPMLSNPLSPGASVTGIAAGAAVWVATAVAAAGSAAAAAAGAPVSGSAGTAADTGPAPATITAHASAAPTRVERSLPGLCRGGCTQDELKEPHDAIRSGHLSFIRIRMTTGQESTSGPVITIGGDLRREVGVKP